MITRSLDELSILDRMVLDFTQVSYLVASINTDEPRKVLNAIKSIRQKSLVHLWHLLFTIVKFRVSCTYYRETLLWAKLTIVTALHKSSIDDQVSSSLTLGDRLSSA